MLRLLEEEQENENMREEKLMKATPEERKKLEKEFGLDRAKAQTKIQKLSE